MKRLFLLLVPVLLSLISCKENDCSEPDVLKVINELRTKIENNDDLVLFNESRLASIDTVVIFPGSFNKLKREYLGMGYSFKMHIPCESFSFLPPPYETANYILFKLVCKNGEWNIDWLQQENKIEEENIIDIEGDGLSELVFKGSYDCNGGMMYGFYYIAKFVQNEIKYIYESESIDKIAILPNSNLELVLQDTIIKNCNVELADINADGVKEVLEKKEIVVYNGGETRKEILENAIIVNKADTLYLNNGLFK